MAAACVVVTWSPALYTTSNYLTGFLRTCEHVTLSVSQEHNSRQTKTDQVQTDPRNREPAAGMGCSRQGEGNQEPGRASRTVADTSPRGQKVLKIKLRW